MSVDFAYRPELWTEWFSVVALAAAGLTGLLSVALSIHLQAIVGNPAHMARARESLFALTVPLLFSILGLIPGQGRKALGIELIVLGVLVLAAGMRLQTRTLHRLPIGRRRSWKRRLIIIDGATVAIILAGAGLVTERLGGLLWLLVNILICIIWATYNAWTLVVGAVDVELEEASRTPDEIRVDRPV